MRRHRGTLLTFAFALCVGVIVLYVLFGHLLLESQGR